MDNKEGQAVAVQVFSKCRNEGTKYLIMFATTIKISLCTNCQTVGLFIIL